MIKIRLYCNAGMSTSLLVEKMKAIALEEGLDVNIEALPIHRIGEGIEDVDVVLLGPQVGYMLKKTKTIYEKSNIPVEVIPMKDYGMCNGANVLAYARTLIK